MTLEHERGGVVGMKTGRDRSILPLPEEVVAQIKSSTAIVSLTDAVLELLKNALDAKATRIEAAVDFARGACSVEDDGLGIAPNEFREDGGLGKLYCTSKYHAEEACLGRNGTFLASLAAMSLLTIASRHHEHRSHNMMTFHHSKPIDRRLPAPPQHEVYEKHGTRVTVWNLFGNLPVRVKQRAMLVEQKTEHDRLWKRLEREVTGLLLSWCGQVSLKIRDMNGKTFFSFSNTTRTSDTASLRSSWLNYTLNVLTQANYILIDEWPSWVPTSASTSTISIQGAISRDPAPSKRVQFLSFGIRPLSVEFGNNELYDEVNRIFSQSSFGTVEDDARIDENGKVRRQNDKRFKSDGYTNRQLTARKGVDRYPMFHLRITLKGDPSSEQLGEQFMDDDTNLQAVMEVLGEMITQWLSAHHFRLRKTRLKRNVESSPSTPIEDDDTENGLESDMSLQPKMSAIGSRASELCNRKRKRFRPSAQVSTFERTQHRAFAEWSRVKSGKVDFFDNFSATANSMKNRKPAGPPSKLTTSEPQTRPRSPDSFAKFDAKPLLAGSLNGTAGQEHPVHEPPRSEEDQVDEVMIWTDPSTRQTFLLNARTGCVLPRPPSRPLSGPCILPRQGTLNDYDKALQLAKKPATSDKSSTPWLNGVLESWDNPVFKCVQKGIQQACHHEHQLDDRDHKQRNRFEPTCEDIEKVLNESSTVNTAKLHKAGLENAHILAQLDKKFILAKTQDSASNTGPATEALVLIDQHAADERAQVEALFIELCMPPPKNHTHSGYCSKLGHQSHVSFTVLEKPIQFVISNQEQGHFITHAARFAAWGILLDVEPLTRTSARQQSVLSVTTLPPVISERCRADPQVLITFLRSAVWKYVDATNTLPLVGGNSHPNDEPTSWVRRLSTCPEGLIDLINSRACRSAIMFNDELSLDKCKELVKRLSECVFPFTCAHGRPSMVPLVNLGAVGDTGPTGTGYEDANENKKGSFMKAWKNWKHK